MKATATMYRETGTTHVSEDTRRLLCAEHVVLNGKPAVISGVLTPFASVRSLDGLYSASFAWHTVRRIVRDHDGGFKI